MLTVAQLSNLLDAMGDAGSADVALRQIDAYRRLLAGPGIFSIQLNVTTREDPRNELYLQRLYSSLGATFPVQARKHKTRTLWTETLFVRGQVFVGEGVEVLERTFDDYAAMRPLGLNAVVNVPMVLGQRTYATFNVFGTRGRWQPEEVLGLRLLALAAARWVSPAPELDYAFDAPSSLAAASVNGSGLAVPTAQNFQPGPKALAPHV